jgi:hypothetical protein
MAATRQKGLSSGRTQRAGRKAGYNRNSYRAENAVKIDRIDLAGTNS